MSENKTELFLNKENCCGCSACMTVCPKSAIEMKADEKGFLYPEIDYDKCVSCGLCVKTCAFQNGYVTPDNFDSPVTYAVKHKNYDERKTSRSGGMFAAVTDWVLEKSGVIYGAGYDDGFTVIHKRAETKAQAFEFKGSKYVQSDMNTIFSRVIKDLKADRYVLFSGTPCQTAGLYSCLKGINTDKLIVCDLVCHGTPSPRVWKDYLEYQENKHKSKIVKTDFRDKRYGWNTHLETLHFENGKKISSELYARLFYKRYMLRPSCSECKYTNLRRPSDITLADFWGVENAAPELNDNRGISLILLNTEKAKRIFDEIKDNLEYKKIAVEKCMQYSMQYPTVFSERTDEFWNDYAKQDFKYILKKYSSLSFKAMLKTKLKMIIKAFLK